jgi:hypothetical protein
MTESRYLLLNFTCNALDETSYLTHRTLQRAAAFQITAESVGLYTYETLDLCTRRIC